MQSNYKDEFSLIQDFLENLHIPARIINSSMLANSDNIDFGIYAYFFKLESTKQYLKHILAAFDRHTLYKLTSNLLCKYYLLFLPEEEMTCACIGPFLDSPTTDDSIRKIMAAYQMSPSRFEDLLNYYNSVQILEDSSFLHTLLTTFCSRLWGGIDQFSFSEINMGTFITPMRETNLKTLETIDHIQNMNILAERYTLENEIIQAISRGELHTVQMLVSNFAKVQTMEKRSANPLRNEKNYTIIFNTLCRKAAELGKVHPIYIDNLSTALAYKIENCRTSTELKQLQGEMVRKYCLLVRNHSMQHYSQLIQRVLTIINFDLTADLSLAALASQLNVNASYLSTRFKQEQQETLTDYITKKRVEQAIFLLNSTDLSISEIANRCGIPDLQYFSKIFKKHIGHTPSSYKKLIRQVPI